MKKIKYLILIFALMIPVLNINALDEPLEKVEKFNVVTGDNITDSKEVKGSSLVAGDNVTVENTVAGIDMAFGNNVTYKGNSDYTLLAGNNVNLKGITKNDGFIFGNAITFDKEYKSSRDLFVFASSVILRGEIDRDVKIYASNVILENVTVKGNVYISATNIEIKEAILETLTYNDDATITISSDATINLKDTFTDMYKQSITDIILDNIVDYVGLLFTFAVLALIIPTLFKKIEDKLESSSISKFISMMGYGLFLLILIPIIFILLITTTIGVPLSIILLALYIITILLSTIFTGYFIGLIIWKKYIKKDINILLVGLIGISIIKVLSLIPYVGVAISLISLLLSFAILMKLFTKDA